MAGVTNATMTTTFVIGAMMAIGWIKTTNVYHANHSGACRVIVDITVENAILDTTWQVITHRNVFHVILLVGLVAIPIVVTRASLDLQVPMDFAKAVQQDV